VPNPNAEDGMERLLTAEEVAKILNVSVAWVYDHADRKRPMVPSVRLGKAVRFRPEDIEQFVREMTRREAC
jgi:excisionase family DNA binding protein